MKNTKIIKRLIDYYLEGSELTQEEHNTVRSLKEEMQAINYTRCCKQLKDKEVMSFAEWFDVYGYYHADTMWLKNSSICGLGKVYQEYNKYLNRNL
jgi:hypothetical protein